MSTYRWNANKALTEAWRRIWYEREEIHVNDCYIFFYGDTKVQRAGLANLQGGKRRALIGRILID